MVDVIRGPDGEMVILVGGTLGRADAARLASCLGELPPATPLVLDFSRADYLPDAGLPLVARGLATHHRMKVRGLDRHHRRLLRYCGAVLPLDGSETDED